MQIIVDNLMTQYSIIGQSEKTILMLHGWGDTARSFGVLAKKLSKNYSVVSLDLPGFGQTQPPETVWGLEDYAIFLKKFLKKINKDKELACVIGHSNGGALAIKALSSNAVESDKLVLLSAAGIRDRNNFRRRLVKIIAKAGKVATFWMPKAWRSNLQLKLYGAVGSDMFVVPQLKETFKKTVRQDVQVEAKNLKLDTLIIYGDNDKATPVEYGRTYNQLINGSNLKIVKGAGHFVHHDDPVKVYEAMEEFLK